MCIYTAVTANLMLSELMLHYSGIWVGVGLAHRHQPVFSVFRSTAGEYSADLWLG